MKLAKHAIVRYLAVGSVAYLTEMAVLYVLLHNLKLSAVAAVAISFWIGFVVAFVLQKWVTFQNYDKTVRTIAGQLVGYSVLVVWNYLFTLGAVKLFAATTSVFIIRTVVIVIITSWNFVIYGILFKSSTESRQ